MTYAMMSSMDIRPGLHVDDEALAQFCRRHAIRRLAVFGSALGNDFRDDSDVDILAEFAAGHSPGLMRIAQMELELAELIGGREVEIRTYEDLSRHFRDAVAKQASTLYAAA
ncbi:MAG TPA: nucleotidyltransferase domain-containing protein [Egibacteraceae bacterium]|nr:nucleotidyltransferase domain-containing protein [Egibacteraceae bacterium]